MKQIYNLIKIERRSTNFPTSDLLISRKTVIYQTYPILANACRSINGVYLPKNQFPIRFSFGCFAQQQFLKFRLSKVAK